MMMNEFDNFVLNDVYKLFPRCWYIIVIIFSVDMGKYEINVNNLLIYHIFNLIPNTDNINFT